jgi:hypothetical protein
VNAGSSWFGTGDRPMTRRWRTAAPGLILLGLVILTVVLLLAGYGVPVGVGLLAGLVLGGVIGLFSGLWLGVRGRGRSMTIGSMNISPMQEGPSTEMPEIFRDIDRVQRVDHSGLVRVIPGGAVADTGGVTVELIALEIRAAGAVAHLAAAVEPPNGTLGSFARVAVEDDVGTAYVAAAMGTGGSPDRMRFEVRFAPPPSTTATILRVRVDEFVDPYPMRSLAAVVGPWTLTVDLTRR